MKIRNVIVHAVLLAGAAFVALPFFWMISTSLKTAEEVNRVPPKVFPASPQFGNYPEAVSRAAAIGVPFGRCFLNSAAVALAVTAGVLLTGILAGFAFGRMKFPGKNAVFLIFLSTMMIPFEVTIIPNFILITRLGWYDTYAALIMPWAANVFSIFFLRRVFERLPQEIYDTARIDGCGNFRFLASVAVPMARPALITVGLQAFLGSWNAFLWPLLMTSSPERAVIQKGLSTFLEEAVTQYQLLMAAATLTILPVVLLYLFAQKWFERGTEEMVV